VRRKFDWPKSPGEHVILKNVWKEDGPPIETYKASGGYANLKKASRWLRTRSWTK
jgi:hypothetical protein